MTAFRPSLPTGVLHERAGDAAEGVAKARRRNALLPRFCVSVAEHGWCVEDDDGFLSMSWFSHARLSPCISTSPGLSDASDTRMDFPHPFGAYRWDEGVPGPLDTDPDEKPDP